MMNNFDIGDKVRVVHDIATIDGMLYKDEIVKVDAFTSSDKDMRVLDSLGKIWYIDFCDVTLID